MKFIIISTLALGAGSLSWEAISVGELILVWTALSIPLGMLFGAICAVGDAGADYPSPLQRAN